jgi:hypothetical protein
VPVPVRAVLPRLTALNELEMRRHVTPIQVSCKRSSSNEQHSQKSPTGDLSTWKHVSIRKERPGRAGHASFLRPADA